MTDLMTLQQAGQVAQSDHSGVEYTRKEYYRKWYEEHKDSHLENMKLRHNILKQQKIGKRLEVLEKVTGEIRQTLSGKLATIIENARNNSNNGGVIPDIDQDQLIADIMQSVNKNIKHHLSIRNGKPVTP